MILLGDAITRLKEIEEKSVQTCITSPPYWGLRDYGSSGQLGMEKTPEEFVANMVSVFREVKRVLKDDGTLWLNLGDSYASSSTTVGVGGSPKQKSNAGAVNRPKPGLPAGFKPKDLVGIPWRVAFALQADGWYLRQDIIWHKPNPMPESVRDRCTKSHEYIFLMSKRPKYYFDVDSIKEPAVCGWRGSEFHTGKTGTHQLGRAQKIRESKMRGDFRGKTEAMAPDGRNAFRAIREMRQKRSVWSVSTKPFRGAHFATFPPDLIEPCVLAGSKPGDIVLDPFFGAGTTGLVAKKHGRKYLGVEINQAYIDIAEKRLCEVV